ncbi:MAG: GNAT family N-acetyltransferase [Candidatus Aminicenantales bacterium]
MPVVEIVMARSAEDYALAKELFLEYAGDIGLDLSFQNFDEELAGLTVQYGPSEGGILLLSVEDRPAGCVAVRRFEKDTAELKRMYVRPAYRGQGYGRRLGEEALALARRLGYQAIRLDTLPQMGKAIALYQSFGFVEIEPYRFNPVPGAKYFELEY